MKTSENRLDKENKKGNSVLLKNILISMEMYILTGNKVRLLLLLLFFILLFYVSIFVVVIPFTR